ncbi:MAG: peptide ABC transporter substrate-binding protein [Opitutaceae bacterium]|nr:peptide ABC transporter substrate-binding protein [Opitutaceae bacterium]
MRRPGFWLLASVLWLLAAGCFHRETTVQRGDRGQILHRGIGSEVSDLDPQLVTGLAEQCVVSALFEGLVTEDPHDLHPVPGVAERWEVSSDGLVYTFHLRADAKWSNGDPVTAEDFVASYRRLLTPALAADNAGLFYLVLNAEAFNQGRLADFSQVGFTALDARTLRITLAHPAPYFLGLLTQMPWLPVPVHTIERYGPVDQRGNAWTRPGRLVGNGPFVLKTWRPNQVIVVEKSPSYWDAARVRLHAIHFHPLDSQDAEERAFRAGQLHVTYTLPVGKVDAYRRTAPQFLRRDPYFNTYFFRLNVRRPPLDHEPVRRALALAVDRPAIVEHLLRGGQQPASSLTPPTLADYAPPAVVTTDFDAARRLLAEAGYPGGRDLPPLELLYNNSENHRLLAEAVQEMWRRELGVDVRLVNQELKVVLAARRAGQYQILLSDWVGDYPDAGTFLEVWRGDSGNNHTGWSSADYDTLLLAAERTVDPAGRGALLQRAESRLLGAMPVIPLYFNTHVFLLRPSVQGWYPTVLDHHPYKYVWLQE